MKYRWIFGILVLCVSVIMLMPNVIGVTGFPPIVWAGQATLSNNLDYLDDQDPENSGFNTLQVSVWEHWNGGDWDIWMKISFLDGALGTWAFPPVHPAMIPGNNEINPAVAVTRTHPATGQEIHVVYERTNPITFVQEICHTYTNNFGLFWSPVTVLSTWGVDSTNPACVYSEDLAVPGVLIGFLCQVVWEENIGGVNTQIMYDAYVYDPTWGARGTLPGGPYVVTPVMPGGYVSQELPEIASVDERSSPLAYDHYFAIVWQQRTNGVQSRFLGNYQDYCY